MKQERFVVLKQLYMVLGLFQVVTHCAGRSRCRFLWVPWRSNQSEWTICLLVPFLQLKRAIFSEYSTIYGKHYTVHGVCKTLPEICIKDWPEAARGTKMLRDPASDAGTTQPQSFSQNALTSGFKMLFSVILMPVRNDENINPVYSRLIVS